MAFKKRHKEVLVGTFSSLHDQLVEMDATISDALHPSDFSRHVNDLSPAELKAVADYIARLRSEMRACLEEAGVPIDPTPVGLRWALQTAINAIDVAVSEMSPKKLTGYGTLSKDDQKRIAGIQERLHRINQEINGRLGNDGMESNAPAKRNTPPLHSRYL